MALAIGIIGGGIVGVIAGVIVTGATSSDRAGDAVAIGFVVLATTIALVWAVRARQ